VSVIFQLYLHYIGYKINSFYFLNDLTKNQFLFEYTLEISSHNIIPGLLPVFAINFRELKLILTDEIEYNPGKVENDHDIGQYHVSI